MCDLLAISAGFNYTPRQYLPLFAEKGKRNLDGWGIGFFRGAGGLKPGGSPPPAPEIVICGRWTTPTSGW